MNSFYEYFAAQQKLAAYRQAKRLQRGVKLGYNQSPTADSATKFTGGAVPIGVGDFSVEYFGNSYGSGAYPFLSSVSGTFSCRSAAVGQNGVSSIIVGDSDDPIQVGWAAQSSEDRFYLAVTRSGVTVKVYINGELKATKEQSEVKDLGNLQLAIANSSDVGFVRVWNMCLSADDVTAHYNNGDPMGYVVPKAMRDLEPVEITGGNSYTWAGAESLHYYAVRANPIEIGKYYKVNVTVSDFQSGKPHINSGRSYTIPAQNGTYDVIIHNTNPLYVDRINIYGGAKGAEDRYLTLTVNSITPVGLLAEYLPQNLMKINKPSSPDISFPTSAYTESKNTFAAANPGVVSNTTFDNPAENGFSGSFIKDVAITRVSVYCAYHNRSEYLNIPIRLKVEYRCNADIYDGYELSNILLQANESDAKEAYINYGPGYGFLVSAPNPDAWLEIRVLSIEFWDGVSSSWLDSAKQLPLSDEYLPPLFQSIGGYDMTANGAPEIIYNE